MFERLRTFHQEFMAQFKDTNWQDGFTGFSFQWWQYSIQTIWYVSILIYQGKVFWCKIYVWRSKTLTCLQISISRERLNSFDDSSFIYDFQSFSIDFPSQIWLYIISQKKTRKCSTIVAERVLNVSGKLYTNVLNHTTRKNNIQYNPLLKLAWKKETLLTIFWLFPSLGHWSVLFPFQRFSGPFLVIFQTQIRT